MGAFNGSGTFVRTYSWADDAANAIKIRSDRMDTEDDGFATGLSSTICRDGQSTTTARIPFAVGIGLNVGSVSVPSLSATGDTNTGLYFPAADTLALTVGGTKIAQADSTTAWAVTGNLSASGTLAITGESTLTGQVTVAGAAILLTASNAAIEIGKVGTSNTPFIDFHSSASSTDYDVRMAVTGGTASDGAGTLTLTAAAFAVGAATTFSVKPTVSLTSGELAVFDGSGANSDNWIKLSNDAQDWNIGVDGGNSDRFYLYNGSSHVLTVSTSGDLNVSGQGTFAGAGITLSASSAGIELGATGSSNTPFIDFHSSSSSTDYDVRLQASGGTGSAGVGTLTMTAGAFTTGASITTTSASGVAAKNTPKAFARFSVSAGAVTFTSGNWFNVASVTRASAGNFDVTFTNALASANYVVGGNAITNAGKGGIIGTASEATGSFRLIVIDDGGNLKDDFTASIMVV